MKRIQSFILLIFSIPAFSQRVINVDDPAYNFSNQAFYSVGRVPFNPYKYVRVVAGSPYFSESWMKGAIMAKDSSIYSEIRLKLDLLSGILLYLNEKNEEMESIAPILEVSLTDTLTNVSYFFIHSSALINIVKKEDKSSWYQVLTGDAIPLYKQYYKDIYENKPYNSSITEQTIRTSERYFIIVNKTMTRIKKLREIPELLPDKRTQVLKFINEKNLSGKKDEDFIAVMQYYNSLK